MKILKYPYSKPDLTKDDTDVNNNIKEYVIIVRILV